MLCTSAQTFSVRQVQSSNVLYILRSASDGAEGDGRRPDGTGLVGVAQCGELLEAIPSTPAPAQHLRERLPVYRDQDSPSRPGLLGTTAEGLERDAPFSRGEFNAAWKELCAFELEGRAWIPSPTTLERVWASLVAAATIKGVGLEEGFRGDEVETLMEEDGNPGPVVAAVLARIGRGSADFVDGGEFGEHFGASVADMNRNPDRSRQMRALDR